MKQKQVHKSNWLVTMLLLVMAILMPFGGAWAQTQPSSGDGSVGNPYKISTAAELAWFRDEVNNGRNDICAKIADGVKIIDLKDFCHAKDAATNTEELSWAPIGNDSNPFYGTFDGNGKTISNLYINATSDNTGFFGYADAGRINNITFDNAKVNSTETNITGILAGKAMSCMIDNIKTMANCSVEGKESVGGIAGYAEGNIINSENHAKVNGTDIVGGIVGDYACSYNSITSCANYGAVTGSGYCVGGLVGNFVSGTILNSANYGDVTGGNFVGNLIGGADECNLNNVLGTGDVTTSSDTDCAGLLIGYKDDSSSTASGILAYNSSAKLTINGTEQTGDAVKAIGYGSMTSAEKIMAFSAEQLKSGLVAFLLQKNASESAKWGQNLNTDNYPLPGSADKVYSDSHITMKCSGELEGVDKFTNTKPAQEGTLTFNHGDSPVHHESVTATCFVDGKMEYWECNLCHKSFSDKQMTQEVSNLVVSATGHEYNENDKCKKCQQEISFLTSGDNNITLEKTYGSRDEISGYNLYKYTAPEDGTLAVTANSNGKNTYGTLWESRTAASCLTYNDDEGNSRDFKITYMVTKGTTYYIGARQYKDNAIECNATLNVKLTPLQLPSGMAGNGSEAKPFLLKTADHLAWFRDCVNEGNINACAKIADDVKAIDMSTVCHKADTGTQVEELCWTPIGNSDNNKYQGTFDGNGKTISNLYINATSENTGFFGNAEAGSLKNITFDNARVNSTGNNTGILAGSAGSCMIENIKTLASCSVVGNMSTGGIAGSGAEGNIINCENHAAVKGTDKVGGILGAYIDFDFDNSITSCANYGAVTGTGYSVGGMVGQFSSGIIQNSANYGDIAGRGFVGNLIGNVLGCKLNNVLGTGNVTATSDTKSAGLLVGSINNSSSTASGILAYNSSAKLTINKTEQTDGAVKTIGDGSLTYPEGKNEADVIKAFTAEQLKSGEVAYLLNGSKSEGKLAWYQKLSGTDANPYPVLTAAEGNTVYFAAYDYCYKDDKFTKYGNDPTLKSTTYHDVIEGVEFDADKHIYQKGCRNEGCTLHKYVADADGTLEATESTDGKFYVEELKLTDASTAINTQAEFTVKNLQYSRQLTEGQKGYVTLCLPFDIKAAEVAGADKCYPLGDMMIHMPTEDASVLKFVLMLDEQSDIKAGTPMVVELAAENAAQKLVATAQNVEYNANFFAAPAAKSLTLRDWDGKSGMMPICHDLTSASIGGVYTATTLEPGSYSLGRGGKFGIHEGDLSPYRVYLNIQTSQSAPSRAMMFSIGMPDDSSTTGIRIINMADGMQAGSSVKSAAIYTLEGQRINGTPGKGIYIKNGKKFIVK